MVCDDSAITLPPCNIVTSVPSDSSNSVIVLISDSRGALVRVRGSSDSNVTGINVRAAFLAPAIGIWPDSRVPPLTMILSIWLFFLFSLWLWLFRLSPPDLRLASGDIGLQRRLEPGIAIIHIRGGLDWCFHGSGHNLQHRPRLGPASSNSRPRIAPTKPLALGSCVGKSPVRLLW